MPAEDEKIEKHPSYGMIGISYVSSTGTHLFGSEFKHQHFITLKISECERHRSLARDWYFGRNRIIEVSMSEAQFVEMVGRPNHGDGIPCTLGWVRDVGRLPDPPIPDPIKDRYTADMEADAARCTKELREAVHELNAAIDSGKIGKTALRELSKKLEYAACAVDRGIPFVRKSFHEEMEKVVNHAATEIEATVSSIAMRLGIEKMQQIGAQGPKLIEASEVKGDV